MIERPAATSGQLSGLQRRAHTIVDQRELGHEQVWAFVQSPLDTVEKSIPYGFKHGLDEPSA